jgi:hypothetical protein
MIFGVCAKLAATLSAVQIGLMTLLVWAPILAAGHVSEQHWIETVVSCALTTGAWVVAESYRPKAALRLHGQSDGARL